MIISDGNGNTYTIAPGILLYSPVTPANSSSGIYSGGNPAAAALSADEQKTLRILFDRALGAKESHSPARAKGTMQLLLEENVAKSAILKANSAPAGELEAFLKKLRAEPSKQIPVQYRITRDTNPWQGMTESSAQEARNRTVRAVALPLAGCAPVSLPEVQWRGRALLHRGEAAREIVVDSAAFSILKRVDAARLKPGEEHRIGQAVQAELQEPQFLLPFLLRAEIVQTYWHTDSQLRLTGLAWKNNRTCFQFDGEHHYYTNEKNTDPLHFAICTDAKTREIFVTGR